MESNRLDPAITDHISHVPVGSQRYVYMAAIFAAIGGLLFGYDTGVISGALIFIKKTFGLSTFEQGLAVSSVLVGAAVTAITGGSLSDRFGRRKMLLITSVIFMAVCGGMLRGRIHPGPCCWTSNFRSGNWARELRCSSFHRLKHAVGRYPSSN